MKRLDLPLPSEWPTELEDVTKLLDRTLLDWALALEDAAKRISGAEVYVEDADGETQTLEDYSVLYSDHGEMSGLADDDHTQYLLIAGSRAMTGALDMSANAINNVSALDMDGDITMNDHDILDIGSLKADLTISASTYAWEQVPAEGQATHPSIQWQWTKAGYTATGMLSPNYKSIDGVTQHLWMLSDGLYVSNAGGGGTGSIYAGNQFVSFVGTGTAPVKVSSTTMCANLNADLLDGYEGAALGALAEAEHVTGLWYFDALGIGTATVPHGGVGRALVAIEGTNASEAAGPHLQVTTDTNDYALFQMFNWAHDDISMVFDGYYQGGWKSSDAGSSFLIRKYADALRFQADVAAPGGVITWVESFYIKSDAHVLVSADRQWQFRQSTIYANSPAADIGRLVAPKYWTVGTGTPTHLVGAPNSFHVSGKSEFDGQLWADDGIRTTGTTAVGHENLIFYYGGNQYMVFSLWPDDGVHLNPSAIAGRANANFILTQWYNKDHDHTGLSASPTWFGHGPLDPDISSNEWYSIAHDATGMLISTGPNVGAGSVPATIDNYISFAPRGTESFRLTGGGDAFIPNSGKLRLDAGVDASGTEFITSGADTYTDIYHGAGGGVRFYDENNLLLTVSRHDAGNPTLTKLTGPVGLYHYIGATLYMKWHSNAVIAYKPLKTSGTYIWIENDYSDPTGALLLGGSADAAFAYDGVNLQILPARSGTGYVNIYKATDAQSVAMLTLEGDRATMGNDDEIYQSWKLSNDAGQQTEFARMSAIATAVADGAETGALGFKVMVAGGLDERLRVASNMITSYESVDIRSATTERWLYIRGEGTNFAGVVQLEDVGSGHFWQMYMYATDHATLSDKWRLRGNDGVNHVIIHADIANGIEYMVMAEDGWIGDSDSTERIVFDGSGDHVDVMDATLHINQLDATAAREALLITQSDVDQPYIKFEGADPYIDKTGANEYIKVRTPLGVRWLRLYT